MFQPCLLAARFFLISIIATEFLAFILNIVSVSAGQNILQLQSKAIILILATFLTIKVIKKKMSSSTSSFTRREWKLVFTCLCLLQFAYAFAYCIIHKTNVSELILNGIRNTNLGILIIPFLLITVNYKAILSNVPSDKVSTNNNKIGIRLKLYLFALCILAAVISLRKTMPETYLYPLFCFSLLLIIPITALYLWDFICFSIRCCIKPR